MKTDEILVNLINNAGFDHVARFDANKLELKEAVRQMCADGRCKAYGHSWSCPPECGSLDDFRELFSHYSQGILLQTVSPIDDGFDYENMTAGGHVHKQRIMDLLDALTASNLQPDAYLFLSAGTCTVCPTCAHPEPCVFPDKRLTSMEATGLVVTEVCTLAGLPYNYGPTSIAYSCCILY